MHFVSIDSVSDLDITNQNGRVPRVLAPLIAAVMTAAAMPYPQSLEARDDEVRSMYFMGDEHVVVKDVEYDPDDEVRPCDAHDKSISMCANLSPKQSALEYGLPESWKWQWRHAHYGQQKVRSDPWRCLSHCRVLEGYRRPERRYSMAEQKQDCVDSCQQYFIEFKKDDGNEL